MDTGESIGMMAGAYFVGRIQLLRWINELTGLGYTKIEQTASGVFVCHVFDALFPGLLKLEKVKFDARHQYEYVHNYKVLQGAFNRANMKKQVDVEKLIRGKYQDNLEFIQWVKAFYDSHASEDALNYDGRARREEITGTSGSSRRPALAQSRSLKNEPVSNGPIRRAPRATPGVPPVRGKSGVAMVKKSEFDRLKEEYEKLEAVVSECESEREFYFAKLREVEDIAQELDGAVKEDQDNINLYVDAFAEIKQALYAAEGVEDPAGEAEQFEQGEENLPPGAEFEDEVELEANM